MHTYTEIKSCVYEKRNNLFIHLSTAIPPPIDIIETDYTTMYDKNETQTAEGLIYSYTVHAEAQFGIECNSIGSVGDEFVGDITWYKKAPGIYLHTCVYNCIYT